MRHGAARWFKRPHGVPSGVWTGQTKPHDSGNSFRTVVVFISAKNAPGDGDGDGDGDGNSDGAYLYESSGNVRDIGSN